MTTTPISQTNPSSSETNPVFTHQTVRINGFSMHYVTGGQGQPLLLLHGYPQTWYAWRYIIPELAKHYMVIAADLRGLGDSEKTPAGYDSDTQAEDIRQLVQHLGYTTICLIGHDWGASVAYQFAVTHPIMVEKLVVLDAISPVTSIGKNPLFDSSRRNLWWFPFHMIADLPEILVSGRESLYLRWFYTHMAFNQVAITEEAVNEYVRCYAAPGGMTAGFNYYRGILQDTNRSTDEPDTRLLMPVLALGGDHGLGMASLNAMKLIANQVSGGVLENCGHYLAEEQPQLLLNHLLPFLNGNQNLAATA